VKYAKAAAKLIKDREGLLAFYDFPAKHWKHIQTTNPPDVTFASQMHCRTLIESTFATVRPLGSARSGLN